MWKTLILVSTAAAVVRRPADGIGCLRDGGASTNIVAMSRVAFLTAASMLPGHPAPRPDVDEHALQFAPLADGCDELGIELVEVIWDDRSLEASSFDAFVIGTTWDYTERPDSFLARLDDLAAVRPVWNPVDLVRWNLDKRYLADLAARGARIVPTRWVDRVDRTAVEAACDAFDTDRLVAKPSVGAGAWRQARLWRDAPLPGAAAMPPGRALLQPFLESIESHGEFSFLFLDGEFSHAVQKLPRAGDYRSQSVFGASVRVHEPLETELDAARTVLGTLDRAVLYARVDMVRDPSGGLLLMELELVEPFYYPEQAPGLGARFARVLADRL